MNHRHVQIATDGCYGAFKGNDGGFSSCRGRFRSLCLRRDDREGLIGGSFVATLSPSN